MLLCNLTKPDYSIWEESIDALTSLSIPPQYCGFTQIHGHHRFLAAAMMVEKYYKDTKRAELRERAGRTDQLHLRNCSGLKRKDTLSKLFGQQKQKVIIDTLTATMAFNNIVTDQIKIKNTLITSESSTPNLNAALQNIHKTHTSIFQSGILEEKKSVKKAHYGEKL
ncbi:hypothetical protein EIN_349550 [Entamoeba invadens IP1]|uniref:Uncharacterized protein n=1 Tax=Entamoeba invadens IP1 TaxID=370355 RepID=A0A0A1UBP6_ENTIV|nr:hypothetical protein EIN_349550 [Entamoeba invadens IP1]ELP89655.1 hypothetical protein EIN_349550 [Entamoeba invadens IP1]|eukprot:XP_004256426.1 hypothetical protein EIN_349550 [Entamoeba invadens IP1]